VGELSDLKTAGQTYSQLLEEMIEDRKKARFFRDMERMRKKANLWSSRSSLPSGHREESFGVHQRVALKKQEDSDRKMQDTCDDPFPGQEDKEIKVEVAKVAECGPRLLI